MKLETLTEDQKLEHRQQMMGQQIVSALRAIADAQDPAWGTGIYAARSLIATLLHTEKPSPRALGAILLGFLAFSRFEGALVGTLGIINEIEIDLEHGYDQLAEGSTKRERTRLLGVLNARKMEALRTAPQAYEQIFASLVRDLLASKGAAGVDDILTAAAEQFLTASTATDSAAPAESDAPTEDSTPSEENPPSA